VTGETHTQRSTDARDVALGAVTRQAEAWPEVAAIDLPTAALDPRDARLASAIYHATLRHWLTLADLLRRFTRQKRIDALPPAVQALLLTGAAQLIYLDKLPDYAVIDETVRLARRHARSHAGMINAVLRRVAALVVARHHGAPYEPEPKRLPIGEGFIEIAEAYLPPVKTLARHLSIATSHPLPLVEAWLDRFGREATIAMLLHGLREPPIIVHAPGGVDGPGEKIDPHEQPGFAVWRGEAAALGEWLSAAPQRWVQDPAAARAVAATAERTPRLIIDYCAGRGTKTRQLRALHPGARIIATDIDPRRFAALAEAFRDDDRVEVAPIDALAPFSGAADLLLLDVPCSNTGVLARRIEARYRYDADALESLVALQRRIIEAAAPLLAPHGALLYSTCSIEPEENERQADWAAEQLRKTVQHRETITPAGADRTHHDGGYFAIIQ